MGTEEIEEVSANIELIGVTETERVPDLNKRVSRRKAKINSEEQDEEEKGGVEITFKIERDSIVVRNIESVTGNTDDEEDDKMGLLGKGMEKKRSSGASLLARGIRLRQVFDELKYSEDGIKKYDRTNSAASHALEGLRFINKADAEAGWEKVKQDFRSLTKDTNGLLHRSKFAECIGMKNSKPFADRLFNVITKRRNFDGDLINEAQMRKFWDQICDDSLDSRLITFFEMIDKDADGVITEEEIEEIIILSASTNKLPNIKNHAGEYAALIMEELDPDGIGFITVEQLEVLLLHGPNSTGLDSKDLNKMLSSVKPYYYKARYEGPVWKLCTDTIYFLQDNWKRNWILVLWIGVMLGLFAYKFVQYRRKAAYEVMGHCVCMAKGAAETLKLNMAIILLPVCRNTVTWLRSKTKLGIAVPFNDNINFHKVIAVAVAIGVGIHAIYHLACDFPRLLHANSEKYKLMEPFFGKQPTNYWHFVKSWEGVTGIIMVVLMTIAFTLASPWFRKRLIKLPKTLKRLQPILNRVTGFNIFWYSHHLFVFVYALLIVHGFKLYFTKEWYKKTTWMYLAFPIIIYAFERLTRILRSHIKSVKILKVVVYGEDPDSAEDDLSKEKKKPPENVLALCMSKPEGFKYKSGQYMFVNCVVVSQFEWHPFSITSAPGDDYLSVHIKGQGDWTKSLITKFSESSSCRPSTPGQSGRLRAEWLPGNNSPSIRPKVRIDGPYGAPAQDYKQYRVLLLVGTGIGATPMISIIKDILNNIKAWDEEEGITIEEGRSGKSRKLSQHKKINLGEFKTRKVYFFWVASEQGFFDWFKEVINEVAKEDYKRVIEIYSHLTSVYEDGDARSALITMIQSLNHAKNGMDIVNGTPIKSYFARPNWRNVYEYIHINHQKERVGVFYCGLPNPVEELRSLASSYSHRTCTKFDFHKENF